MLDTDGHRIYAIGDIHGQINRLNAVQAGIARDLVARPHDKPVVVYIGDYVDRGPDSRGVIDSLIAAQNGPLQTQLLLGNHDQRFLDYLDAPSDDPNALHWFDPRLGGVATLASYGITGVSDRAPVSPHADFTAAVPDTHVEFLRGLKLTHRIGSYVFVHAGIVPGVPLEKQIDSDLIWIRDPFLNSRADHGFVVVHGHTVHPKLENHGNRIAIDTGAGFDGPLSCLVLEGNTQAELRDGELLPIEEI